MCYPFYGCILQHAMSVMVLQNRALVTSLQVLARTSASDHKSVPPSMPNIEGVREVQDLMCLWPVPAV